MILLVGRRADRGDDPRGRGAAGKVERGARWDGEPDRARTH